MNRTVLKPLLLALCILFILFKSSLAVGKPDVTRHEAHFLGGTLNMQIEWQSANPVVLVRVSVANTQREIKVDAYDNKRNRDGYAGEVNVTVGLDSAPPQGFAYVIQLEDDLRIKSSPVTGKVKMPSPQKPATVIKPQQPFIDIDINQNISQQGTPPEGKTGTRTGVKPGARGGAKPGDQSSGQQRGHITVIIRPETVIQSGAMWRVGNGPWKKSGESIPDLGAGTHIVEFHEIDNWNRPENQKVTIEGGQTVTINGTYRQ
jgi:hypothetical protein